MFGEVGAVLEFGFEDEDVGDELIASDRYVLHVHGISYEVLAGGTVVVELDL